MNPYIDDLYHRNTFTVKAHERVRLVTSAIDFNEPSKGLKTLLETIDKISNKYSIHLTIVTQEKIKMPLVNRSFPIKTISSNSPREMIQILKNQDIYVTTSAKETFCLGLAEAITLGMPAIALDSVGNREYIFNGNYIFVKDRKLFEHELVTLFNFSARQKLNTIAKKSMRKFTVKSMISSFVQIIA